MGKHKSPNTSKYLQKQKDMIEAAHDFINGMSMKEVLQKHNVSYASVYNTIKRYQLDYKYTYGRTVFFNEDYFQDINSEHKAYWLGFLFADGCIQKTDFTVSDYNRLSLSLSIKDIQHVYRFAEDINMPSDQVKVQITGGFNQEIQSAVIRCNSIKMCTDLQNLGYTGLKKDRKHVPDLTQDLIHHFIRGYFDGDGSIWGDFRHGSLDFQSSGYVLKDINRILHEECNVPLRTLTEHRNSLRFSYGGRLHIISIGTYLYENATIYLDRKLQAMRHRCFRETD